MRVFGLLLNCWERWGSMTQSACLWLMPTWKEYWNSWLGDLNNLTLTALESKNVSWLISSYLTLQLNVPFARFKKKTKLLKCSLWNGTSKLWEKKKNQQQYTVSSHGFKCQNISVRGPIYISMNFSFCCLPSFDVQLFLLVPGAFSTTALWVLWLQLYMHTERRTS